METAAPSALREQARHANRRIGASLPLLQESRGTGWRLPSRDTLRGTEQRLVPCLRPLPAASGRAFWRGGGRIRTCGRAIT